MSLPEKPETRNETFLSAMAGEGTALPPDPENDTREQQYMRYIVENGGSGDVTGVKGDAETDYRIGNVNMTAADIGAYTAEQVNTLLGGYVEKSETVGLLKNDGTVDETQYVSDISGKTDKVTTATENNLAAFDNSGNLKDSGKSSNDFAPANIVPSTATTSNKLSTAADTAAEEIASNATGTSIALTDSADGYVQGVGIKGKSRTTKNLLEITATTQEVNGVTFTVNSNGTIKANGTASTTLYFKIGQPQLKAESYYLNGSVPQSGVITYNDGHGLLDIGLGSLYTFDSNTNYPIYIKIASGTTVSNVVFKPMLCLAADYAADPTFEQYFDGIKSIGDAGWGVVDLGTLTWYYYSNYQKFAADLPTDALMNSSQPYNVFSGRYTCVVKNWDRLSNYELSAGELIVHNNKPAVAIKDDNYTDTTAFKSAMNGVLLYYPLADATGATPTLGITSKDGAGQGTAATITTGLPLRSVSDTIFDTLDNDKVVKKCGKVKGSDLTWETSSGAFFYTSSLNQTIKSVANGQIADIINSGSYTPVSRDTLVNVGTDKTIAVASTSVLQIRDSSYDDLTSFEAAIADVEFVFELATPTTTPLTSAEKSALVSLRTYNPNTQIDATDSPSMTVDYLLNTDNGQAVAKIDKKLSDELNNKITVSDTLTLAANAWSNGAQTVTFAHDTARRNVIDITPSEIETWAQNGVYAYSETSSGITFKCSSVPSSALTFKVTSMEVG